MIDSMKPLRLGIYAVINGQLTYDSAEVPIYDEKVFTGSVPALYVLLSTQQETPAGEENDCMFIRDSFIDLEIIRTTRSEVSKDTIDDVSNQIYQLLIPSHQTAGFAVAGFQISNPRVVSVITNNLVISDTESILRKIIKLAVTLN